MSERPRVLIVEPDAATRSLLVNVLSEDGYAVVAAADGPAALDVAEREPPQLVLVNARMAVMDVNAFVAHVRSGPQPHPPLVVLSTGLDLPVVRDAAAVVPMPVAPIGPEASTAGGRLPSGTAGDALSLEGAPAGGAGDAGISELRTGRLSGGGDTAQ
jgi:CheY-like chemotaxis protein